MHDLKIWPEHFEAVVSGRKTFEVRADDRDYAEGDTLLLREWNPDTKAYTGRTTERRVSHLLRESAFVRDGFVILSLATPTPTADGEEVTLRSLWGKYPNLRSLDDDARPALPADVKEAMERMERGLRQKHVYLTVPRPDAIALLAHLTRTEQP